MSRNYPPELRRDAAPRDGAPPGGAPPGGAAPDGRPLGLPFYVGRLQLVDENGTPRPVTFAQVAKLQVDEIIRGHIEMHDRFTLLEQRVARFENMLDRCIQDDGKSVGIGIGMTLLTESANRCTNVAATTAYSAH